MKRHNQPALSQLFEVQQQIYRLAEYIKKNPGAVCLFLGAGASISSGGRTTRQIVDEVVEEYLRPNPPPESDREKWKEFNRIMRECRSRTRRCVLLQRFFEGEDSRPSQGYRQLARLVKKGFFKLIFTTNFDPLLERALTEVGCAPNHEYLIYVRGVGKALHAFFEEALVDQGLAHLIKLHGDFNTGNILFSTRETSRLPSALSNLLRVYMAKESIVIGYSGYDRDIMMQFPTNGGVLWWVNPENPFSQNAPNPLLSARRSRIKPIYNQQADEGEFDKFMNLLYYVLGREETQLHRKARGFDVFGEWIKGDRDKANPNEFFLGDFPRTHHIAADLDVVRTKTEQIISSTESFLRRNTRGIKLILIRGSSGSGKTTLMLRIGFALNDRFDFPVLKLPWENKLTDDSILTLKTFQREIQRPTCLLIDDFPKRYKWLAHIVTRLSEAQLIFPILLIASAETEEWDFAKKHIDLKKCAEPPGEFDLEYLDRSEMLQLQVKLARLFREGKLQDLLAPSDDLCSRILNDRDKRRPALPEIYRLTHHGAEIEEVIAHEYQLIHSQNAMAARAALAVCLASKYGTFLPGTLIQKFAGLAGREFDQHIFQPCRKLLIRYYKGESAGDVIKARHETIADVVVSNLLASLDNQSNILLEIAAKVNPENKYERQSVFGLLDQLAFKMDVLNCGVEGIPGQLGLRLLAAGVINKCVEIAKHGKKPDELSQWISLYNSFEKWPSAKSCYESYLEADPDDTRMHFRFITQLILKDEFSDPVPFEKAAEAFERAIHQGKDGKIRERYGQIYNMLEQRSNLELKAKMAEAAIRVNPTNEITRGMLTEARRRLRSSKP